MSTLVGVGSNTEPNIIERTGAPSRPIARRALCWDYCDGPCDYCYYAPATYVEVAGSENDQAPENMQIQKELS